MKKYSSKKKCPIFRRSYLIFIILLSALSHQAFSQAATATWASTANGNVVTTGNITATAHTFSAGLNTPTYDATYGARATNWGGGLCTPTFTKYYEYTVSPSGCNDLEITQVSFIGRVSFNNRCWQLYYSIDGGAESQLGPDFTMVTSNTNYNFSTGAVSVNVLQGQTITFHLYGSGSTGSTFGARNFVVNGTTVTIPSTPLVTITPNPGSTVCPSTSVTFTATPTNGGTTPAYQWKLNGGNVGTNSPNYTNAGLVNGDQVWCVMTSNSPCASPATATSNIITMTISSAPATPGAITGPASVAAGSTGLNYSIAAVSGATTYNWTVPAGWSITGGLGTVAITVTSGAAGGNITVTAENACGISAASSMAVSIILPHDVCNQCHINHTAPGGIITAVHGNSNLCISCHNPTGSASSKPFENAMKAVPGVSGTSHQWDIPSVNAGFETNKTTNNSMLLRLPNDSIICSTCHNQHQSAFEAPFLRVSNGDDLLCKNCHTARIKGTYASNPANKSTHPIDVTYNLADTRFQATSLPMKSGKVVCSSCHSVHASVSADGNILRVGTSDNLCASCHTYQGYNISLDHEGMTCTTCHYAHQSGSGNIYLVNDNINTPNSGSQAVGFTTNASGSNYADANATFNGVCEVCHTLTDHFTNSGIGTADARHIPNPVVQCITCHPHNQAFYAQTNCFDCHNTTQDKPGVGPVGGRRQIVDANGDGTGAGGDYKRTSHHVTGSIPQVSDCIKCHYMGDHKNGDVKLFDPDLGYANIITYDPANKASVETFCIKCHDADGANGDTSPFSDGVTVPVVDATLWNVSAHKTAGTANANTCLACHDNGHGSNKSTMLGPYTKTADATADPMDEEEEFCLTCHGNAGVASAKVHLAFSSYTNTATNIYKHDPTAYYRKHDAGETAGSSFGGANRHVECVDCHNPHGAQVGTATAPTLFPTMIGAKGVEPIYAGVGAPTGFTWQSSVTQEYQVCFKCHSNYTTLPTYLPGGFYLSTFVADGLKKVTTGGTNNQVADSRNMALEFNPNSVAFHPVMAAGKNLNINATAFQTGWSYTSRVYCSDCHTNENAGAGYGRGPHGSANLHMLDNGSGAGTNYNYVSAHGGNRANSYEVCTKCHKDYTNSDNGSRFPDATVGKGHAYHTTKEGCFVCHDSHGSEAGYHLMNFSANEGSFSITAGYNSQSSFAHGSGTGTNTCYITCHGKGHGSGKAYNPAY